MPKQVPCNCREYLQEETIVTRECDYCTALELLELKRTDVENIPLIKECNQALAERGTRLQKALDSALGKERETRRVANSYMADKRQALYALRGAGIDETEAAALARKYEDEKSSASD